VAKREVTNKPLTAAQIKADQKAQDRKFPGSLVTVGDQGKVTIRPPGPDIFDSDR
jgi:hypothetical protein